MSTETDSITEGGAESGEEPQGTQSVSSDAVQSSDSEAVQSELPLDIVFEIIRNERRRLVLTYLEDASDERVTLSDLAEHIAAIENDTTVQALSAQQRKRVYVGLYQCHLPKMADSGIVSFNKNRGVIEPGPNIDQLKPYLDTEDDAADGEYDPLVLGGVAVLGYALAAFGGFTGTVAGGLVVFTTLALVGVPAVRDRFTNDAE